MHAGVHFRAIVSFLTHPLERLIDLNWLAGTAP